jgi:phosphatidylinositol-3-phosphatase
VKHALALLLVASALAACPSTRALGFTPELAHVVLIVFENKQEGQVIGSRAAPTFTALSRSYVRLTQYHAVTHPSLPNYLALTSGGTQGIRSDCTRCVVDARNLADTLDEAGRTWKTYAEGLPHPGYTGARAGRYVKKHVPFLYFRDVVSNPQRRANVVPLRQLAADLDSGALPDFALVVPDLCHSMHDCPVRTGDRWLHGLLPPLLELPGTVVFVTFDEGAWGAAGNHVAALALGTAVRPATRIAQRTGHYGLLRTIEAAWGLPLLGRSAAAKPIAGIWRRS